MEEKLLKEIGGRIKEVRRENRLTQDEMVKHLNCGRSNYSRIESGQVMPGGAVMAALQSVFNISLNWLFTGQGAKYYDDFPPDFGDYSGDVRRMIRDIAQNKAIKHSLLSHYFHYKVRYKKMLEEGEINDRANGE